MWRFDEVDKVPAQLADTHTMIISDKQALLAARDLKAHHADPINSHPVVSDDLMAAARAIIEETPELRGDRVTEARDYLGSGEIDSRDVAAKMISRIISDSVR